MTLAKSLQGWMAAAAGGGGAVSPESLVHIDTQPWPHNVQCAKQGVLV